LGQRPRGQRASPFVIGENEEEEGEEKEERSQQEERRLIAAKKTQKETPQSLGTGLSAVLTSV